MRGYRAYRALARLGNPKEDEKMDKIDKIDPAKVVSVLIGGRWLYGVSEFRIDGDIARFTVNWRKTGFRKYSVALSEITGYEAST
jgi:hypothetical protein